MKVSRIAARLAVLGATGALGLTLAAAPSFAASGPIGASVSIASQITLSESSATLNYGNATPGTRQVPGSGTGINADGSITLTVINNDASGWTLSASAPDWSSPATPNPLTFPASSLDSAVSAADGTTLFAPTPLVEGTSNASASVIHGSGTTSTGQHTYNEQFGLTVPTSAPSSTNPYTTTITQVLTPM